ncbi:hypothetical protein B0H14DRAFT_2635218 [Mycena olivaceomarginata]|nr:hypothetical protein B0H14DRAFT_2635218 [Mycena olivaceomarginata]
MPVERVEEWQIAEASDEERGTSARDAQPDGRTMGVTSSQVRNQRDGGQDGRVRRGTSTRSTGEGTSSPAVTSSESGRVSLARSMSGAGDKPGGRVGHGTLMRTPQCVSRESVNPRVFTAPRDLPRELVARREDLSGAETAAAWSHGHGLCGRGDVEPSPRIDGMGVESACWGGQWIQHVEITSPKSTLDTVGGKSKISAFGQSNDATTHYFSPPLLLVFRSRFATRGPLGSLGSTRRLWRRCPPSRAQLTRPNMPTRRPCRRCAGWARRPLARTARRCSAPDSTHQPVPMAPSCRRFCAAQVLATRNKLARQVPGRREHPRVDALARDALRGAHQRPVPDSPARLVASAAHRSRQTHPARLARRHGWARCPLARAACRRPAPDSPVLTPIALISHLARCYPGPPRFADSTNTNPIVRPSGCASRADVPRSSSLASAICHSSTRSTGISFSFAKHLLNISGPSAAAGRKHGHPPSMLVVIPGSTDNDAQVPPCRQRKRHSPAPPRRLDDRGSAGRAGLAHAACRHPA